MNNQDLPLFDTPITPSEETDREITEYLIRRFNLADAILCSPPNRSAVPQRIFYYSADSKLLLSDVNLALSEELATHIRIDHVIRLNTLPLNMDGDIDLGKLRALPIYSEGLLAEVEQQVAHMLGTHEQVAILVDYEHQLPWIHVDELIAARSRLLTEDRTDGVDEQSAADTASRATKPSWLTAELPEEVMQNNSSLAEMFLASCRTGSGKFICLDASLQEDTYTYYDILSRAQSLLTGLRLHGLQPAEPVLIQLSEPAQIITAFWACQFGGFIPLILPELHDFSEDSRQGRNYRHVWQVLNRPLTITSDEWVEKIAALFDQQLTGSTARVVTYRSLEPHPATADYAQPDSRTTALYVLSSGSTGVPKIIPLTHYNLITRALATNALTASKPADICLAWLPFDHIGTISDWHIRCVLLSNTVVLTKHEVLLGNILYLLEVIDKYRVTHTWAPNFAYALMNAKIKSGVHADWDLSCVVTLLSAGEAVLPSVIREFHALLLPHKLALGAIKPAFGMAETGSGITYFTSRSESVNDRIIVVDRHSLSRSIAAVEEGHPRAIPYSCLGGPIPGMSLRIVDQHQKVVEQGVMGQLQVTGTALFAGYYNAPDVNADSFTDDGWFPTGDLGFIYNDQLVICGREKEVIIINGVNISAAEVEGVTEQVQGVLTTFTCACAVQDHNQHEVLAIFFAFDDSVVSQAEILTQIRKSVTEKVGISPTYLIPLDKAEIPKTPIGKIQRTQLMQWFANGLYKHIIRRTDLLLKNERTNPPGFIKAILCRKNCEPILRATNAH
jgi:acyl-CoA synthetase (AMP-forming)/AMP-acid ligase II